MRKTLHLLAVFTASLVLLSSCSSTNNGFSKQKYTGFKKGDGQSAGKANTAKHKANKTDHTQPADFTTNVQNSESDAINTSSAFKLPDLKMTDPTLVILASEDHGNKHRLSRFKDFFKSRPIPQKTGNGGDADANMIIMILLCIFLPPIAILIHEGVGTPFWLDLILWLIGGVWFFGVYGNVGFLWILGLIAIIYAFMRCF